VSLELISLTAISPLDGRYGRQTAELREVFSEFAFMRERLRVEVEWLVNLSMLGLPELPRLPREAEARLRQLVSDFGIEDCTEIKAIEAETNHDVKAVEYFIKRRTQDVPGAGARVGVHSFRLYVRGHQQRLARADAGAGALRAAGPVAQRAGTAARVCACPCRPADAVPHARPAGKPDHGGEGVRERGSAPGGRHRRDRARSSARQDEWRGSETTNAHLVAYRRSTGRSSRGTVVEGLGLTFNPHTIQIEPHDYMAELFDAIARANTVLLDPRSRYLGLCRARIFQAEAEARRGRLVDDAAQGQSDRLREFRRQFRAGQCAAAATSRKSSRCRAGSATSRIPPCYGNLAWPSDTHWSVSTPACAACAKLEVNEERLRTDLDDAWEVLAEPVQTVMRRYGVPNPYEQLKALTRGKGITREALRDFILTLDIPAAARDELLALTPATYIGKAADWPVAPERRFLSLQRGRAYGAPGSSR